MRRVFNGLAVLSLVVSLSVPAYSAPRRDDGDGSFFHSPIKKIVQVIKRAVKALDTTDISYPKP